MTAPPSTRELIVVAADRLFYEQGFEFTSFAHIAEAVGISRGNFYHHFKSKDEILRAVIVWRQARTRAMLDAWAQAASSPAARIRQFIDMLIAHRAGIVMHGCPVGTLCTELAKLDHAAQADAAQLFTLFRDWLSAQFLALHHPPADADRLAMHLLARSQGIAALAQAFRDEAFIRQEVSTLHRWLDEALMAPASAASPLNS